MILIEKNIYYEILSGYFYELKQINGVKYYNPLGLCKLEWSNKLKWYFDPQFLPYRKRPIIYTNKYQFI